MAVASLRKLMIPAFAAGSLVAAADIAAAQAHDALDGRWMGSGMQLIIDAERAQARLDPRRPFQWEPFTVRNMEGNMIVFMIGPHLFIAYVDGENLKLTSPGAQQASALHRINRTPN